MRQDHGKVILGLAQLEQTLDGTGEDSCDGRNGWAWWRLVTGEAVDVSKDWTGSFRGRARLRQINDVHMQRKASLDWSVCFQNLC